jgi:hypothetical protein
MTISPCLSPTSPASSSKGRLPEDEEVISAANFALVKAFEISTLVSKSFRSFPPSSTFAEKSPACGTTKILCRRTISDGEAITSVPVETSDADTSIETGTTTTFLVTLLKQSIDARHAGEANHGPPFSETPCSQSDVARRLKLSRERIRQIYDAAMEKLRKEMRRKMNESGVNQ